MLLRQVSFIVASKLVSWTAAFCPSHGIGSAWVLLALLKLSILLLVFLRKIGLCASSTRCRSCQTVARMISKAVSNLKSEEAMPVVPSSSGHHPSQEYLVIITEPHDVRRAE